MHCKRHLGHAFEVLNLLYHDVINFADRCYATGMFMVGLEWNVRTAVTDLLGEASLVLLELGRFASL